MNFPATHKTTQSNIDDLNSYISQFINSHFIIFNLLLKTEPSNLHVA